jgi:hypothetical protein
MPSPIKKGIKVKELFSWPPPNLSIDPSKAVIKKVLELQSCVSLTAEENGEPYMFVLMVTDNEGRKLVSSALSRSLGQTVAQIGDVCL